MAEETDWISLYSGNPIQPSRLFTQDYDIEHIIPKARLFDDSFQNKTLCESPNDKPFTLQNSKL